MNDYKPRHRVVPFPRLQRVYIDWFELQYRIHTIYILLEVDVTDTRRAIRAYRTRAATPLSLTTFLSACFARAIDEDKLLHAYRKGRGALVLFEDVDITIPVERDVNGQKIPVNVMIRAANGKSLEEIDQEIRTARTGENPQSRAIRWIWAWLLLPRFLRLLVWKRLMTNPYRRKQVTGTTLVTNAGMFGSGTGWGMFPPPYTSSLLVGSIARKPRVVGDHMEDREYLCLTVAVDHDIVDGAAAARFTQRLKELIEGACLLEGRDQDTAHRARVAT